MEEVFDSRDGVLLGEAKRCQEAGAYRAAFILTWIAVAEGLRWRFKEMSLRDGQMAKWVEETDKAEMRGETIDQRLLDRAKSSGLISDPEYKKVSYLKDMRNSFAHPSGAAPTAVEVSAAIQVAVDAVLSRPPLLGHGFARELVNSLFDDLHFLDDVQDKVQTYADFLLPLLNPEVVPWLVEQVITRLDAIIADPQLALFTRRAIWLAQQLLTTAGADASTRWRIENMLNNHPLAACHVAGDVRVFSRLTTRLKDMIFGWLAEPAPTGQIQPPSVTAVPILVSLDDANLLDERQRERWADAISRSSYPTLQQSAPFRIWASKLIADLDSHNWYTQNPAAFVLGSAGPEGIESCDSSVLEAIGRSLLASADGEANDAVALISRLQYRDGGKWPAALIKGMLLETVLREDGTFRVKPRLLPQIAEIVAGHTAGEAITSDVANAIRAAAPSNRQSALRNGLEELDDVDTPTGERVVHALTEATRTSIRSKD
jgi:hypothetical protein